MNRNENIVNATQKSLRIIDVIQQQEGSRLADIARRLDVSKSTVHKHLNTLRNEGYVTKEGEVYHIGLRFLNLGQYARYRNDRFTLAEQKTIELASELNLAVDFDMETNGKVMTLFHEADASSEIGFREGDYFYVHTSSTGKAILSTLSEEVVRTIVDNQGLQSKTEYTISSVQELLKELDRTRERGYAIVDEEWLEGHRAVGVPVTFPNGTPFGALSAGGPTYRLTNERVEEEVAPTLVEAATALSDEISTVWE